MLAPAHQAVRLVHDLVALVDSSAMTKHLVSSHGRLSLLAARAREIAAATTAPRARTLSMMDFSFCELCGAYHQQEVGHEG